MEISAASASLTSSGLVPRLLPPLFYPPQARTTSCAPFSSAKLISPPHRRIPPSPCLADQSASTG